MKLSDKIITLRRMKGMTQEDLAELCHVSRQSVSKWEADIALPEVDKLLIMSEAFHVSLDMLLKDELTLDAVQEVHHCGCGAIETKKQDIYEGLLIKESITDDSVLDLLHIHKVELWRTGGNPKYWTALSFTSSRADFPERIAHVMVADPDRGGNWYVDFKATNEKYIVFKDLVLRYRIGNQEEKDAVCAACREKGITDAEMNWSE